MLLCTCTCVCIPFKLATSLRHVSPSLTPFIFLDTQPLRIFLDHVFFFPLHFVTHSSFKKVKKTQFYPFPSLHSFNFFFSFSSYGLASLYGSTLNPLISTLFIGSDPSPTRGFNSCYPHIYVTFLFFKKGQF